MLPRLAVLCLAACLMPIEAFPSGAPESACDRLIPQHPNNRTGENYPPFTEQFPNVTNPYVLRLSDSTVQQGQSLIVSIELGNTSDYFYEGFFLVAVSRGDISVKIGRFSNAPDTSDWKNGPCNSTENENQTAGATHKSADKKYGHTLEWKADTSMTGEFCIHGAIVHETEEWFKFDGSDDSHCFVITEGDDGDEMKPDGDKDSPKDNHDEHDHDEHDHDEHDHDGHDHDGDDHDHDEHDHDEHEDHEGHGGPNDKGQDGSGSTRMSGSFALISLIFMLCL